MKKMLVLVVSLMLFSCSSDSVTESNVNESTRNLQYDLSIEDAVLTFEKNFRGSLFTDDVHTMDDYTASMYQISYDFLKNIDEPILGNKEEVVGAAIAKYYSIKNSSSVSKKGARIIEILNNTSFDMEIPALSMNIDSTGVYTSYLHSSEYLKLPKSESLYFIQTNNMTDYPFCLSDQSQKWDYISIPNPAQVNIPCYDVQNLPSISNAGFIYLRVFKNFVYIPGHTAPSGTGYELKRKSFRHLILPNTNVTSIEILPNGVELGVLESAMIIGNTDIQLVELVEM